MTTYNGWTNYETWLVNLWLTNDSGSCDYWAEQALEAVNDALGDEDPRQEAAYSLAKTLEAYHDDMLEECGAPSSGVFADLLNAALGAVNWQEIAEALVADVDIWCARFNSPGALPEAEPAFFTDWHDASAYLVDIMRDHDEQDETLTRESAAEQLSCLTKEEPVAIAAGGIVYVIARV